MATPFEEFVNRELPRRSALLTVAITGYDGDPNDPGAPAIIQSSPLGTFYQQESPATFWRKNPAGSWDQVAAGGGGGAGVNVEDDGTPVVSPASTLDFAGDGVSVTDAGGGEATITIPGGGGSSAGGWEIKSGTKEAFLPPEPTPVADVSSFSFRVLDAKTGLAALTSLSIFADTILSESVQIVSDPDNIIDTVEFVTIEELRNVRITGTGNSGTAEVLVTWNDIEITLTVIK